MAKFNAGFPFIVIEFSTGFARFLELGVLIAGPGNQDLQFFEATKWLLTFQFNTRIESFISKFKIAELSVGPKAKFKSILAPLISDEFDPFDTSL